MIKFRRGAIVCYLKRNFAQPKFMMWNSVDGKIPSMEKSCHRWSPGDFGIVIDSQYSYLKILKFGGGIGWIMETWAKKISFFKKRNVIE